MAWRHANGREQCNDCREVQDLGAPVWRGEYTPVIWCQPCAGISGVSGGEPVEGPAMAGLDKRKIAASFPHFTAAMRRLKAQAAAKAVGTDVSARILGERGDEHEERAS